MSSTDTTPPITVSGLEPPSLHSVPDPPDSTIASDTTSGQVTPPGVYRGGVTHAPDCVLDGKHHGPCKNAQEAAEPEPETEADGVTAASELDHMKVEITTPDGKTTTTTLGALDRAANALTNAVADVIDPDGELFGGVRLGADGELFDTSGYQQARPQVDGMTTDRLTIKLGGTHMLDPMIAEDVAMFERFHLGQSVELRVSGLVVAYDGKLKRDADDKDTVTGVVGIKIDTVYRLEPEEL